MEPEKISLAPMVGYTTGYARYFYNLLAPDMTLYTEMIVATALLHNSNLRQLQLLNKANSVCQLAGNESNELLAAINLVGDYGYKEINLNLGCPSKNIQKKRVGACMMRDPEFAADLFNTICTQTQYNISIKCRIGIDNLDSYEYLYNFINLLSKAGCKKFIIHARKAWLTGLSPKQNRTKPPIDYQSVYSIKKHFTDLEIIINGEITTFDAINKHLRQVNGVMIGRELITNPLLSYQLQNIYFKPHRPDFLALLKHYLEFSLAQESASHLSKVFILKSLFGLAFNKIGAKKWRNLLTQQMQANLIDIPLILATAKQMNLFDMNQDIAV